MPKLLIRLVSTALGWLLVSATGTVSVFTQAEQSRSSGLPSLVTPEQYKQWQTTLSNWGRWGPQDQMGTLNLITPEKRRNAAALVREGISVSLASDAATQKDVDVPCPVEWGMVNATEASAGDRIGYPCIHGAGTTHLDAFAHIFFEGRMWNGYRVSDTVTQSGGAEKNSILTMKDGIVTRAVLYDIARLRGVPYLEPGTRVTVADLEAWEKQSGVRAGPGDALLFRWGRWARRAALGPWPVNDAMAGLDNSVIPWLKARDIAILGWETPGYAPKPPGDLPGYPVHDFALTILGIHILDRADFDAAAELAAVRKRWAFMIAIAPLRIPKGTGSPVNPLAVF